MLAFKVGKYNNACLKDKAVVLFYLTFTNPGPTFIARDRRQTHEITNQIKCACYKATPGLCLVMPSMAVLGMGS